MKKINLLDINVKLLKIWSIYPVKPDSNILIKILDWLYKAVTVTTLYVIVIPCAYELFLWEKNKITDYTLNIMNTGAYFCSIFTLHFFHSRGEAGKALVDEMNSKFKFKPDGFLNSLTMSNIDKTTRKITIIFFSLLGTGVLMMAFVPLLMPGRILPIPGVYPFQYKMTPYYEILYVLHVYAQIVVGFVTSSSDAFFICMALVAAEQFKILGMDFHNCIYNVALNFGIPREEIVNFQKKLDKKFLVANNPDVRMVQGNEDNDDVSEKSVEENEARLNEAISSDYFQQMSVRLLIEYVKHHQMLLDFCVKMENFFWPLIFVKVAISMFYHIFITFAMVSSTDTSLALTLAQYEICAIAEILIFAIAGQTLINESGNTLNDLFASPWYLCNKRYRVTFCITLMRCTRYTRVSVGKLFDMSLPTFIVIMKTALSYFAVLRQVTTQNT